jgi:hypothetical protein
MVCDICGQAIRPWQDRHSSGSGNAHLSCEIGEPPLLDPAHPIVRNYKLNWVNRIRFWGSNKEDYGD